jgi:modification methylase
VGKREGHDSSAFYSRKLYTLALSNPEYAEINEILPQYINSVFQASSERMAELPDNSVGLMVTSPPYNVGKDYDLDLSFDEYIEFLGRVLEETYRVLVPGGRVAFNVANLGRKPYIPLNAHIAFLASRIGFLMRGEIIWVKGKGASGSCAWGSWMSAGNPTLRDLHEYVMVFSKQGFNKTFKGRSTISRDEFMAATTSVWHIPPESARKVGHPAPFPVPLVERLINLYTFEGEVVLDPFMGSGSTAVAAVNCGRRFVGYETDPSYIAICMERLSRISGQSLSA